jgi:hypothetical protein
LVEFFDKELLGLQPDDILAHTTRVLAALQWETKTIPIVLWSFPTHLGTGSSSAWRVQAQARGGGMSPAALRNN